jgi:tetratricopeptide (TPR) repeat protein
MRESRQILADLDQPARAAAVQPAAPTRHHLRDWTDPLSFVRLGRAMEALGEDGDAEAAYRRALRDMPTLAVAHGALGRLFLHQDAIAQAISHLNNAIALEPDNPELMRLLAAALLRTGRRDDAVFWLRNAWTADPDSAEACYHLGYALRDSDPDEAETWFERALAADANHADAHRELGWLLGGVQPTLLAESHLRRAIELDPSDAWARVYLGNCLWRLGRPLHAIVEFSAAIQAQPEEAFPLWALADAYEEQERWEDALALYARALVLDPASADAHLDLGRMYTRKGDSRLARLHLEQALTLDPATEGARTLLDQLDEPGAAKAQTAHAN